MVDNLNRVVVVYGTKYGSTQRYAEWIAERTRAEIFDVSVFDQSRFNEYDMVLFGSPVYMGRIKYAPFIRRNWKILKTKRVVIFSVTGVPPDDLRQEKVFRASLPIEIRQKVLYYPLRGAFNYRNLTFVDRLLMSGPRVRLQALCWIARDRSARESLARFYSPLDWTSEAAIEPIVALVTSGRAQAPLEH